MASDTKTPAQVVQALAKALGAKVDELKKAEAAPVDAGAVASELLKATISRIDAYKAELAKMEKAEAAGEAELLRKSGGLPTQTPSNHELADANAGGEPADTAPRSVFSLMAKAQIVEVDSATTEFTGKGKPKAGKEAGGDEGSGGEVSKKMELPQSSEKANGGQKTKKMELPQSSEKANGGQLKKDGMNPTAPKMPQMPKAPTLKPAGVPGAKAGEAPKAPTAPKAPGASMPANKMELPQSPEKANGGQKTKKMELPQSVDKANGGQMTKGEFGNSQVPHELASKGYKAAGHGTCIHCGSGKHGPLYMDHSSNNVDRNGNFDNDEPECLNCAHHSVGHKPVKKDEMPAAGGEVPMSMAEKLDKGALSPVFKVAMPKAAPKQQMSMHANKAAHQAHMAGGAPAPGKAASLPSPEEHSNRANMYADFMPKSEKDPTPTCRKCKKPAALCKCPR